MAKLSKDSPKSYSSVIFQNKSENNGVKMITIARNKFIGLPTLVARPFCAKFHVASDSIPFASGNISVPTENVLPKDAKVSTFEMKSIY